MVPPSQMFPAPFEKKCIFSFIGHPGKKAHMERKLCVQRYIFSLTVYKHIEPNSSPTGVIWAQDLSMLENILLIYTEVSKQIICRRKYN